jgi:hypothetical protein
LLDTANVDFNAPREVGRCENVPKRRIISSSFHFFNDEVRIWSKNGTSDHCIVSWKYMNHRRTQFEDFDMIKI